MPTVLVSIAVYSIHDSRGPRMVEVQEGPAPECHSSAGDNLEVLVFAGRRG